MSFTESINTMGYPAEIVPETKKDLPKLQTKREFDLLQPGTEYVDPEGNTRTKPYVAKRPEDFEAVPEGSDYVDPEGNIHTKPKYQGIGFTAQTLFDMAPDEARKEQALRVVYGDKVKKSPLGTYIDDEGILRKPNHGGLGGMLGHAAAETAPAVGMVGGGVLGEAAGPPGAFGGMVLGAMAGRQFNNMMLELAGIHQSVPEQISSAGWEGGAAALGEPIGRAVSAIPGAVKAGAGAIVGIPGQAKQFVEKLPEVLESFGITPERARGFLGTKPEVATRFADITNRGGKVAPSAFAPEAPGLKKLEEFDAVFRAQNVFAESAQQFYEQEAKKLLGAPEIGVNIETPLTHAEKKVSSEPAGRLALDAARHDMAFDDAKLEKTLRELKAEAARPIVEGGGEAKVRMAYQAKLEQLANEQKNAADSAKAFVQNSLQILQRETKEAVKAAAETDNPSGLLRMAGAQFRAYAASIKAKAKTLYDAADAAAGSVLPDISSVTNDAQAFLKALPEIIKQKYPVEISQIAKLAGQKATSEQEAIEPTKLTFGDLHQLRSWLRYGIDYNDLTPGMREGSLKFFEKKINTALHDAEAPAELRTAAKMLDQADAFYKDTIPYLDDQMVRTTLDALKSGVGANPEYLASTLFDPRRTEAMRQARKIVGENLWRGVEAADTASMLANSRLRTPGQFDGKAFASQVLDRVRNGIMETGYSEGLAKRVGKIAEDIDKLEGHLPILADPTDTVSSLMRKAEMAAKEAKDLAERDPIKLLAEESARLDKEYNLAMKQAKAERRAEPLGFLYEDSLSQKAVAAADRILGHQDLITAAANQFGRESPQFKALQKVYVTRFFQRSLGKTAKMREELGGEKGMTEEIQALMFPGVTRQSMLQLVNDMEFLFSGSGPDIGGSLAAASRVLNPLQHIPILPVHGIAGLAMQIPGVTVAARFALGKLFATIMDAVSHPNFANWLAGNLKGSPAQREMVREVIQQRLKLGGLMGAATGQEIYGQNR